MWPTACTVQAMKISKVQTDDRIMGKFFFTKLDPKNRTELEIMHFDIPIRRTLFPMRLCQIVTFGECQIFNQIMSRMKLLTIQ